MSRDRTSAAEIAAIKSRVRLASLIGGSISLEKDGDEFIALCPFHAEDTPSFRIYPDQHAYCFGCGWHGDAIDWLLERERMSFPGAIRHLRQSVGMPEPKTADIEISTPARDSSWRPIAPVPPDAPPLISGNGIIRAYNPK